tara:strand:+ start:115 stop:507 length:393 start_codon:yes stop_codon:yes gene_type:complete
MIPSIRLHLNSFFKTEIEEAVMSRVENIQTKYGNVHFQFYVNEDYGTIAEFVKKYENSFNFKTDFHNEELGANRDFSFFYIHDGLNLHTNFRFKILANPIAGLEHFKRIFNFINNTTPMVKKQKRTDEEN